MLDCMLRNTAGGVPDSGNEIVEQVLPPEEAAPSPATAQSVEISSVAMETPVKLPVAQLVTPRRMENMLKCVASTPQGDAASRYPYYCPLCMEYYQDVLQSKCCGNYICFPCCATFVGSRGVQADDLNEALATCSEVDSLSCPHCGLAGFIPAPVALDGEVRDYSMGVAPAVAPLRNGASPLRVGDSFENLKRKMVPLAPSSNKPSDPPIRADFVSTLGSEDRGIAIAAEFGDTAGVSGATANSFSTMNSAHEVANVASPITLVELVTGDGNGSDADMEPEFSPSRLHFEGECESGASSARVRAAGAERFVQSVIHAALLGPASETPVVLLEQ